MEIWSIIIDGGKVKNILHSIPYILYLIHKSLSHQAKPNQLSSKTTTVLLESLGKGNNK
jgi:hypothetical protein